MNQSPKDALTVLGQLLSAAPRLASDLGWGSRGPGLEEALVGALAEAVQEQISDYGRILLPVFGLGEEVELADRGFLLGDDLWRQRAGPVWQFDGCGEQLWIHAPLLFPLEHIDDWMVLIPRASISDAEARAISPPLIPRLRDTLRAMDWVIADYGGHEGGRLNRREFLELLGERPWIRLEHSAELATFSLERWEGYTLHERFEADIDADFGCSFASSYQAEVDSPVQFTQRLPPAAGLQAPVGAIMTIDVLSDPYATLRRFVRQKFNIDVERLGPLLLWRDRPDELFEFDEREDRAVAEIGELMAASLERPSQSLRPVVEAWMRALSESLPVEIPEIGTLFAVDVPEVQLNLAGDLSHLEPSVAGERLYVASPSPCEQWLLAR